MCRDGDFGYLENRQGYNRSVDFLDEQSVKRLETVASIIVPGFASLDRDRRERFFSIIDDVLEDRPEGIRQQLALFLRILNGAPFLRWGRPLGRLDPHRAYRVLLWFQEAPVGKIRQGFWGLKTLVYMGYYGQSAAWSEVGYAPDFDGTGGSDV